MDRIKRDSLNEWLVLQSQNGEKTAFESLVKAWQPRFFLYALNRLGDREAARDVTQDCLINISRSLSGLKDPAAFPKWSFRILERRCIDCLRRTIREREIFNRDNPVPDQAASDGAAAHLDLARVLDTMDARVRQVLRLFYVEGQSVQTIADICNIPPGTVKSRLFYARKLLSQTLQDKKGVSHD